MTTKLLTGCGLVGVLLSACASPWGTRQEDAAAVVMENSFPIVQVQLNGQGPFLFAVDTGSPSCFVSTSVAEKLGLQLGDRVAVAGPDVLASRSGVQSLQVGGVETKDVPVLVMDLPVLARANRGSTTVLDGYLGDRFLRDYRVTVDYGSNVVLFEKAAASQPLPAPASAQTPKT
jgi:Aspartyl protease